MAIRKSILIPTIGAIASAAACWQFGADIPFKDQWPLFEGLRTSSAIIFAVLGAWVSVLYPSALQRLFKRNAGVDGAEADNLRLLLANIRLSSIILASVMVVGIVAPILKQIPWLLGHVDVVRQSSFGLLGALTFYQLWALLMTIANAQIEESRLVSVVKKSEFIGKLLSNAQIQRDSNRPDKR